MDHAAKVLPYLAKLDDAPAYWLVDMLWVVLTSGEQTGGRYCLLWHLMRRDSGPPPHIHADADEWFYVLEGEVHFRVGDRTLVATAGSFAAIPRGTVHAFRVASETATVLDSFSPAGFERAVMTLGRPAASRALPPPGLDPPGSPQVVGFLNNDWITPADFPSDTPSRGRD